MILHPSRGYIRALDPTSTIRALGDQLSTTQLEDLFASKFIARPDVKAVQFRNGAWSPHCEVNPETGKHDGARIPWRREDLGAHIDGRHTFGHYLLSSDSKAKLFAFDIDLEKAGILPGDFFTENEADWFEEPDLRGAWLNRAHYGRPFMKYQFKKIAHELCSAIVSELEIPCAAAYSGGKGVHVYGFTGLMDAKEVRWGAQIVLDAISAIKPLRGKNFFKHEEYQNLSIEVFPKQDSLDAKDLGNLMRLPLGRNLKSDDPTFFIDMTSPIAEMRPMDAITALQIENPWVAF